MVTVKNLWNRKQEEAAVEQGYEGPRLVKQEKLNMVVCTPKRLEEMPGYADILLGNTVLLVSFDKVDGPTKERMFDYLNGVAFVAGAAVKVVVKDSLLAYAPKECQLDMLEAKMPGRGSLFSK